jgi:alcohol dehydrogenase (cytochrome c)
MKRFFLLLLTSFGLLAQDVTYDRLVNALKEQQNWLTYWGDYSGQRYRSLKQVNKDNVKDLRVEWMYQTGSFGAFQAVPLVVDGVMYLTGGDGHAFALDARTGRQLWRTRYTGHLGKLNGQGTMNRGFAMLGNKLFMTTPNAHVVALDARTGRQLWDIEMGDSEKGYAATMSPLAVDGKIIAGISGGELGIRGFIDAYGSREGRAGRRHLAGR